MLSDHIVFPNDHLQGGPATPEKSESPVRSRSMKSEHSSILKVFLFS